MKKQYITPHMVVVETLCPAILAGSEPQKTINFTDDFDANPEEEIL